MALGLSDWQANINGLTIGAGTPYGVLDWGGLGITDFRSADVPRSQRPGSYYGLDLLGEKTFNPTLQIVGPDSATTLAYFNTLMGKWWLPLGANTVPLAIKLPGLEERVLNGRPRKAPADMKRLLGRKIIVPLEFVSADARIYSNTPQSPSAGLPQATGGRTYARTYPESYGGSGTSTAIQANNAGNFPTPCVITIAGPCVNPSIQNVARGATLAFAITLGSSDTLTIDTDARTVVLNGTASRRSTLVPGSTWFDLDPGTTQLTFLANAYTAGARCTVAFSSAWAG